MNVKLLQCTNKSLMNTAKAIVLRNHSYVPTFESVGRRIDFLIVVDGDIIGMIGIGSSTYPPCKDILTYLNCTTKQYREMFNSIANNWRFCLSVRGIKNLGSQVLSKFCKEAKLAWKQKYGDELKYIITFVGDGHDGAVYKASNWKEIGHTSGLPEHESVSMKWDNSEEIKEKFVKPVGGENRKIIFIKEV